MLRWQFDQTKLASHMRLLTWVVGHMAQHSLAKLGGRSARVCVTVLHPEMVEQGRHMRLVIEQSMMDQWLVSDVAVDTQDILAAACV